VKPRFENYHDDFGTKLVTIGFVIEFNVSVAVMDKILISFDLDSQAKSPLFLRYKLSHAEKINRRPEGGGHRSMSTPLNTPLAGSMFFRLLVQSHLFVEMIIRICRALPCLS